MHYLNFDISYINFNEPTQLDKIFVEVDESGTVIREIGVNVNGEIIHAYPDQNLSKKFKQGKYGLFDISTIQINDNKDDISKEQFENLWRCL